jgi:hypothetical protein
MLTRPVAARDSDVGALAARIEAAHARDLHLSAKLGGRGCEGVCAPALALGPSANVELEFHASAGDSGLLGDDGVVRVGMAAVVGVRVSVFV